jgi:hypothetical protein
MNEPMILVQNNEPLVFIKNIVYIAFALITCFLAILTYLKARKTILQPLKAETAKKQFELLTSLLNDIGYNYTINISLNFDYSKVLHLNVLYHLNEFGLLPLTDDVQKIFRSEMSGDFIAFAESLTEDSLTEISIFEENQKETKYSDYKKEINRKAFDGVANIEFVYLTKKCKNFLSILSKYSTNPFLPNDIVKTIELLNTEFSKNLHILKQEVEKFIVLYAKKIKNKESTKFNIEGIHNEFIGKSTKHEETLKILLSKIKNHLHIEEKW